MPQGYQQHLPHYPAGHAARPQMQTTLTLNINGQPVQINQQNQHIQQQSMGMNNIAQLTNILESINPYIGAGGGQPQVNHQMGDPSQYMGSQGGFGGTIFTQDANNGAIYSSNGHTFNIQGP